MEMDSIRQACITEWGKVPVLETYRQMVVRQQKAERFKCAKPDQCSYERGRQWHQ